jgi:hypothetical protein
VTDTDGERTAVEWFDQPFVMKRLGFRRSRLAELARARATFDEFYDALYEIVNVTLPLEEGPDHYWADDENEFPKRIRIDEARGEILKMSSF